MKTDSKHRRGTVGDRRDASNVEKGMSAEMPIAAAAWRAVRTRASHLAFFSDRGFNTLGPNSVLQGADG